MKEFTKVQSTVKELLKMYFREKEKTTSYYSVV